LKTFDTRSSKATDKIAGKGYSIVTDESLPPPPPGAVFNAEEQGRKFKEARRGAANYMVLEGEFSRYLEDAVRVRTRTWLGLRG